MTPYEFSSYAEKQLHKLPLDIQRQIVKKIDYFLNAPKPLHFAESLIGRRGRNYRFRIDDYRVIFELTKGKILITKVGHRREVYRR